MYKILLFLLLLFNIDISNSQNVYPIDTINNKITYESVKIKFNIEGKKSIEKPFFIDIPQKIPFKYYKHSPGKIHGLIFTNDTTCIVVQVKKKKYRKNSLIHGRCENFCQKDIPKDFVSVEGIEINKNLYCGYYYYKNYFVYYYNVSFEMTELFNETLKSIRRKNKR